MRKFAARRHTTASQVLSPDEGLMDVPLRRSPIRRDNLTGEKRDSLRNSKESLRCGDDAMEDEGKQTAPVDSLVSEL